MAAVHQHHAVGLAAPTAKVLQQLQKAAITSAAQPAASFRSRRGGHRVADPHENRHLLWEDALPDQLQQPLMVTGSRPHMKRLPEGCFPPTAGDVLVEQHQQAGFLQGSGEHELNVGGADITVAGGLDPLPSITAPAEIGSNVEKEGIPQPLPFRFGQQLIHQLFQHLLQPALSLDGAGKQGESTVEVDRGGHLGVENGALHHRLKLRTGEVRQVCRQALAQQLLHANRG